MRKILLFVLLLILLTIKFPTPTFALPCRIADSYTQCGEEVNVNGCKGDTGEQKTDWTANHTIIVQVFREDTSGAFVCNEETEYHCVDQGEKPGQCNNPPAIPPAPLRACSLANQICDETKDPIAVCQVAGEDCSSYSCQFYAAGIYKCQTSSSTPTTTSSNLCCPAGFGTGFFECPFGTDTSKQCCRRFDSGQYDVFDKIQCDNGRITGNYCCPEGYGTGAFNCKAFTDLKTQCCKREGFGKYDTQPKVECTITAVGIIGPPTPTPLPFSPACTGNNCETAIGNISTNPVNIITTLLKLILGISGGIALLLIIFSGYRMMTSQGNPEAIQGARETLTSAIVGLLFIIFSLVLLQVIGADILKIPGFGP